MSPLREPPFATVCRGGAVFAAGMAVPEAAVDEDGGFVFGEEDIDGNSAGNSGRCRICGGEIKIKIRMRN